VPSPERDRQRIIGNSRNRQLHLTISFPFALYCHAPAAGTGADLRRIV